MAAQLISVNSLEFEATHLTSHDIDQEVDIHGYQYIRYKVKDPLLSQPLAVAAQLISVNSLEFEVIFDIS